MPKAKKQRAKKQRAKKQRALPHTVKGYQPFRYPGGKSKLAVNPAFLSLLFPLADSGSVFYEGFVGSASISLAVAIQFPDKEIVITDKDRTISGFWELIANGTPEQIRELEALIMGFAAMPPVRANKKAYEPGLNYEVPNLTKVEYFKTLKARKEEGLAAGTTTPLTLVERAYFALFFNRTTFSGIAMSQPIGGFLQSSEWTIDCRYNAELLVAKVHHLRQLLHGRLTVYNTDICEWLQALPADVPMYLDPPYYVKGEALYPVAMENYEHGKLADILATRQNWIMSYDKVEEIRALYDKNGQQLLEIPFRYSINGKKDEWNDQQEYLICASGIDTAKFKVALEGWKQTVKEKAERKVAQKSEETEESPEEDMATPKQALVSQEEIIEYDLPSKNPGTANNVERSGDRDLYFSWILRQPGSKSGQVRSCDVDSIPHLGTTLFCNKCNLPVVLMEATRGEGPKGTRYTKAMAYKLGIPAYLVRHTGQLGKDIKNGTDRQVSPNFDVTNLFNNRHANLDEQAFIEFLEQKFEKHYEYCRL